MAMAQPHSSEQEPLRMTETEYLAFEEKSDVKHEFVAGKVYAMAGADWNHNIINGNIQTSLNTQLVSDPCAVVSSDMRLKVASKSVSFRYPDTMVICDEPDFVEDRSDTISNPTIIIEVLSPSTALKDHNQKLDEYIKIDSLQDYILISQHQAKIEVYTRHISGKWLYSQVKGLTSTLELSSIGCTISLSQLYAKTIDLQDSEN